MYVYKFIFKRREKGSKILNGEQETFPRKFYKKKNTFKLSHTDCKLPSYNGDVWSILVTGIKLFSNEVLNLSTVKK